MSHARAVSRPDAEHPCDALRDVEAEIAVLGAWFIEPVAAHEAAREIDLRPEHFSSVPHQELFRSACSLYERTGEIDIVLLRRELEERGILRSVGGTSTLSRIMASVPSAAHVRGYSRIVADLASRRHVLEITEDVQRALLASDARLADVIARATEQLGAVDRMIAGGAWPTFRPFGSRDLPEFPIHVLPRVVADWCAAKTMQLQVPADLPAMLALAALFACVAGKCEAEPRRGWREVLAAYVMVEMDSAERKSAVLAAATRPIYSYQDERARSEAIDRRREADMFEVAGARVETAKKRLASAGATRSDEDEAEYEAAISALDRTPRPRSPFRLIGDDATPEKLASLLAEQGGRFASFSAEGGLLRTAIGATYSKSGIPTYDVILKAHAGDPIAQDRKNGCVAVPRPVLVLGLAVQPEILRNLAHEPMAWNVGLLARFWFALPASMLGARTPRAPPTPEDLEAHYTAVVRGLLEIPQRETPMVLAFTSSADDQLEAFERQLEPRLGQGGDLHPIRDWGGKLAGSVVRIAAVLALADAAACGVDPPEHVDAEHVARAIEAADYLVLHALAAMETAVERPEVAVAKRIVSWYERVGRATFTARDAFLALKGGAASVQKMGEIWSAIDLLVARGYIAETPSLTIPREPPKSGRREPILFRIRPSDPSQPAIRGIRGMDPSGGESSSSFSPTLNRSDSDTSPGIHPSNPSPSRGRS